MLRRIGWFVSLNQKLLAAKRPQNAEQSVTPERPIHHQFNAVHEIAIYIHRFHNLDLFEEGWYKIKITMRWEDGEDSYPGIPARVVQYEAPEVGANSSSRVWMIDDTDHSFSTPPFQISYAKQDVFLSIMISFYVSFHGYEEKTSAVILKFELTHSPTPEFRTGLLDSCAGSVHEYRIPPKALLGSHSYCPVYFDAFHAVLVDTSVHITLLKPSFRIPQQKFNYSSASRASEDTYDEDYARLNTVALIKSMMAAHDFLLEDLRRISKGINQDIDLNGITFTQDIVKGKLSSLLSTKPQVDAKKANNEESIQNFSWDDMLNSFQSLGSQLLSIWNTFLNFHRENKIKILEFLFNLWANGRKTECSIWMVHSKVEMPHQYMNNDVEGTSLFYGFLRRSLSTRRLSEDPVQTSIMRAELHRQGIAQMRINGRSLQDMFMFGDPSQVPIVIGERLANITRSVSVNSYLTPLEEEEESVLESGSETSQSYLFQNEHEHVLRVVVFVHGFQGHHLDLRLVRNQWVIIDPQVKFLMSEANEDYTSGDIRKMGKRLAKEVVKYLKRKMDKASRSGHLKSIHLSFVGHSMGNLIIRAALTESMMEPYLRYLYTYVSISGPHLGYMYSSNPIFNSGLWLLKKMTDAQCMHQLTFSDDNDLENTFIYNLSKKKTFVNFRNVILLASPQDGYVPYHSARIESCPAASLDSSKQGKVFLQMLNNCLDQLRAHSDRRVVMRFDINFDTSSYGRNLNTFIGRAAHIDFLERDIFIKFIMWSFPELFS
ncbi:hypothetical protein PIB30_022989 [Stylosanthes scabra]|uniref:DUF676 domain-containing protein n=1 Tax=Stylosanthes scabra TaxID=79078 RepID=A0ABU6UBB7_9FABA|nr:hypothetical protein [Stylosanthes scabra]